MKKFKKWKLSQFSPPSLTTKKFNKKKDRDLEKAKGQVAEVMVLFGQVLDCLLGIKELPDEARKKLAR